MMRGEGQSIDLSLKSPALSSGPKRHPDMDSANIIIKALRSIGISLK
jgi:hypothetical protein